MKWESGDKNKGRSAVGENGSVKIATLWKRGLSLLDVLLPLSFHVCFSTFRDFSTLNVRHFWKYCEQSIVLAELKLVHFVLVLLVCVLSICYCIMLKPSRGPRGNCACVECDSLLGERWPERILACIVEWYAMWHSVYREYIIEVCRIILAEF